MPNELWIKVCVGNWLVQPSYPSVLLCIGGQMSIEEWGETKEGVRGVNGNRKDETESRSPPPLLSSCVTFQACGDVFQSMVKCTLFKCWWRNFQWKNRKDETRSRSTLNPLFFLKHIPGQGKNPFHRKRENQHLYNEHLTIDWNTSLNFNNSLHHWSS